MTSLADTLDSALFRSHFEHSIDRAGPGLGAARVQAALDSVNLENLSAGERNVLRHLAGSLSADGYISHTDADALVSLIHSYGTAGGYSPAGMHTPPLRLPSGFPHSLPFGDLLPRLLQHALDSLRNAAFLSMAAGLLMQTDEGTQAQRIAQALNDADLARFTPGDRRFVLSLVCYAAADGHINRAEANAIVDYIRFASGSVDSKPSPPWKVESNNGRQAQIDLGHYTLAIDQSSSQFVLTSKSTGKVTRIWGDPHFDEGGKEVGTFKRTLTLCLDDGTKLTINTVPAPNGQTYSSRLVVTQGDRAMVVDQVNQNSGEPLSIATDPTLGRQLDWAVDDGTRVYEDVTARQWVRVDQSGWTHAIDGDFLAQV